LRIPWLLFLEEAVKDWHLEIIEHSCSVAQKSGFLVAYSRWDGMGFYGMEIWSMVYADYPPQDFHPNFTNWPKSLWGYFPSEREAREAVEKAGLLDRLKTKDEENVATDS
jgi:hypothetical protein